MKITQLEYFCAVGQYHSISQAAQKLYVTQPAISSAIRELEKEFSISLFARSRNHLTLTREGELFYQKASALLQSIRHTTSEFYDLGRQVAPVRIGIPPILSTVFFPDMLTAFQEECPDIPVELFEYGSQRASALVQQDVLDLALVNMHYYEIDKMYSYRMLTDSIVFCVSPGHTLAKEKEVTIEMLSEEPLVLYNTDSLLNTSIHARFEALEKKPLVLLHASQLYTIKNFISQGLAGAFLYASVLQNDPELVRLPVAPAIRQDIGIVWKKGKYINSSVERFISFTKRYARMRFMPG
ncbi:MAG: LysR family transcriptional regulator [Lachnospiraceae bacterium]|nr:LysR family transcriptional regulator [Lachnospiraceae bacterium]